MLYNADFSMPKKDQLDWAKTPPIRHLLWEDDSSLLVNTMNKILHRRVSSAGSPLSPVYDAEKAASVDVLAARKQVKKAAQELKLDLALPTIPDAAESTSSPLNTPATAYVSQVPRPPPLPPVLKDDKQFALDFTDHFDEYIKENEGVYVFRIENLRPEELDDEEIGRFCVADCYIVLKTELQDASYSYNIWTWIGSEAEMDKRFCSAIYGVGLRNWMHSPCKIEREAQDEESAEFLALFDQFEHIDNTHATDSSLFAVEEKRFPLRLYQIEGKSGIHLVLV
jgi:hypothetical protein